MVDTTITWDSFVEARPGTYSAPELLQLARQMLDEDGDYPPPMCYLMRLHVGHVEAAELGTALTQLRNDFFAAKGETPPPLKDYR